MRLLFVVCLFNNSFIIAGVLYSDAELKSAGAEWSKIEQRWKKVEAHYNKKIEYIESRTDLSPAKRRQMIKREKTVLRRKSNSLAVQRDRIQQTLINETNARTRGKGPTSEHIKQSAGTKLGNEGHRAMKGDLDAGGGEATVSKLKEVVKDMGLDVKIKETPGTIEFEGAFEFTVNKTGLAAKPGDAFHQVKTSVDARNKETYVSESMKQRDAKGNVVKQQAGADYVTVQDHKKKAMKGLLSDGDGLVKNPDAMQGMAKGTTKTLKDAKIDDETLAKILKQRGIKQTPQEFREHMQNIKEQKTAITDPAEAKKIRDVSEDVFNAAENKTRRQAKAEMDDLKTKIAEAKASGNKVKEQHLRDELVDSRVKMEETHLANEEKIRKGRKTNVSEPDGPGRKPHVSDIEGGPHKSKLTNVDDGAYKPHGVDADGIRKPGNIEVSEPKPLPGKVKVGAPDVPPKGWKIKVVKGWKVTTKVYGVVTTVVDIGQASQTLEDYVAGKISTKEAAVRFAEQSPIGGLISAGKKIDQSSDDWWAATRWTAQANRQERVSYYQQWYIRLVKSGVDKQKARSLVGDAMIMGDDTELDSQALTQKMNGHDFKRPELVMHVVEADDNVLERTWEVGKGIVVGTYDGVKYIVTAPYRVVEAWGQGELKEADLEYQSATNIAFSKTRMYRLLRAAGISRRRALISVNDFYDNNDKEWLNHALAVIKNNKDMLAKWRKESKKLFNTRTKLHDWYCTNRPVINSKAPLSKMIKAK